MERITLNLDYSKKVLGWPVSVMLRVYHDEKNNLWNFLYSRKSLEQANQESTAIMRTLRFYQPEPPPNVINGEISQNDPYLIVDSENDQYTFEPFAKEEIERMEK